LSNVASELRAKLGDERVAKRVKEWVEGLAGLFKVYWEDVVIPVARMEATMRLYEESEEYKAIAEYAGKELDNLVRKFFRQVLELYATLQNLADELLGGRRGGGLTLLSQALGADIKVIEEIANMRGYPKEEPFPSVKGTKDLLVMITIVTDALWDGEDTAERIGAVANMIKEELMDHGIEGLWDDFRFESFHTDLIYIGEDIWDILFKIYGVIDDALRAMGSGQGEEA
jgi:hypothetical protein